MCPCAPGMLRLYSSHSRVIRSDTTSPLGPEGEETGTVGPPPAALPLNPLLMESCPQHGGSWLPERSDSFFT